MAQQRSSTLGTALLVNADESLSAVPPGEGDDTWHGERTDALVHRRGQHPIHAGLPRRWRAADIKVYRHARGPARNVDVIADARDGLDGLLFPVEWTLRYGRGRDFVSSYGHVWFGQGVPPGMRCAAFQTLMPHALKWLAGRKPGADVPADFSGTDAPSPRP